MSLINTDEEQRWVPTHVQVTVLRARGLRAKGKNGTSDVYTIIQVGKEKYSTCVVEKTTAPEWKEECSFELLPGVLEAEGRSAYPAGSCDLVLTVMHRALIGLDVFLGQATIPLDAVFQERLCTRNEWYKLNSKTGKKEKERGEVQATVQFTRNNLTASMYDLSVKDKPFSAFSRLKDRMKGKKREDVESASAIVPGGFGAQGRRRTRLPSDGGGEEDYEDDEGGEVRRSKMRNFFLRGKLRKSSDTRSSTSLGSESSESSSRGGSLSPTAGISVVVSDLSNSPSETSNLTADNSPEHTAYPSPRLSSHKRAFSDEVGLISLAPPLPPPPPPPPPQPRAVESLKRDVVLSHSEGGLSRSGGVQPPLSQPSLCVNGSHVYGPPLPPPSAPAALGLLQKCAPLSRSLQNLARRPDDSPRLPPASEGRRWSFDKAAKEEKAAEVAAALQQPEQKPTLAAALVVPATTIVAEAGEAVAEGKKQKWNLFSSGKGAEPGQAPPSSEEGGKIKGWFSSKDPHNKPSPEVSPKVDPSLGAAPSPFLTPSPHNPSRVPLSASAAELVSPGVVHHANPFTPLPSTPNISPCNPFFTRMQCNPFFVELMGDHALKSATPAPSLSSSLLWPATAPSSSPSSDLNPAENYSEMEPDLLVGLAQEKPHLGERGTKARASPNPFIDSPVSENLSSEWDESFEAFAASRLGSLRGSAPLRNVKSLLEPSASHALEGLQITQKNTEAEKGSPSLLRRPSKIPVLQGRQSPMFDWTLMPDLKRDLSPPPQIGVLPAEHSMVDLSGHSPTPSQVGKGATSPLWEWDPEKPLDILLSSPQFVNMSSVIPESASSGQPIVSPFGKDPTETSSWRAGVDGFRSLTEEQDPTHSSASVSHALEGIGREGAFTGDVPHVFGDELNNAALPPQIVPEASTRKPEVSLAETNPFFVPITLASFSETPLEGLSSTDALKPGYEATSNAMISNTNIAFRQVTTEAGRENLCESHANVFDFANSVLPDTDAASSLSVTMADNTEINNNSTNDLFTSPSLFDQEEIINEKNSKKPEDLINSDIREEPSVAEVADRPVKAGPPLSFSSEGTLLESVPDISAEAPELPSEKLDEVPAGSPVQVDKEDEVLLEGDGLEHEEPCAEETLRKEGTDSLPGGKETVSPKPSVVSLTEETSNGILDEDTFAPDALGTDSDSNALDADPEDAQQEICEEKNANLSVKESSGGNTLSDYLEARDPGPSISPVADALEFVTAIEDPDPESIWESHDAPSAEMELNQLPLQSHFDEMAAPVEAGKIAPSPFGAEDPSSDTVELGVQPENLLRDFDSSEPTPEPPRLFQDSVFDELHMNESHRPNLDEDCSDTPRDSPADLFQTPEVGSGPESQQTSSFPLGTTVASEDRWQNISSETPNITDALTEDDLSTHKPEVSLAELNTFFVPRTLPSFSETPLEGLTSTDAPKLEYEVTSNPMNSNTNVDFPPVMTEAGLQNVCESHANVFDFANSVLPNTNATSSLSVTMANNTEINSNNTNDPFTSPSLFDQEEIINEKNSKKPEDLINSGILEDSPLAEVADRPVKADPPLSFSSEGTLLESVPDISAKAPELPSEKLDEVPAGSPVQVDKEDEVLLEGDGLEHEEPCAEETLRKEGTDSLPGGKETVSPKPSVVSLTEETSNGILDEDTFAPDALGTDSDSKALDADPEDAQQEICAEENANLSVKESSGGSTLSDYLEARDPDPSISPVADALEFVTAIEDPDPGSIWESHDAPSAEMELNQLPLQSHFDEMAAPVEAGEIAPSPFGAEDPSSDAVELGVQPENLLRDFDSSEPPPEPPRLFQDSVFDELHMNESHQPNSGEDCSDTPRDSPANLFQTPEVGSGPESQQTSSFPLGTTVASEDRWQKIGLETPNITDALTENELSTEKQEVPQFDFSAFGIEETSNQSWLTGKDNFKVKELDTTNFAAWSADEELAIQVDSRSLDKAILNETTAASGSAPVLDYGIQPSPANGFCLPGPKDDDGLWGSYLDPLKVGKPEESVEPTWQSLPCLSELRSTVSQDFVTDMAPEDLRKPQDEEEAQKASSELPLEPALFPQSDLFSGTDLSALPKGSDSVSDLLKGTSSEADPALWSCPLFGEKPKSSVFLHDCNPQASSTPSLLAETNALVDFFPSPIQPDPVTGATPEASSVAPSSNLPAMIDALLMLLPQETQPTTSLPSTQQSSPHPVKPLNATAPQEEKKPEGRSVLASRLEKLKSTIHPGRAAQQGESEANRDEALAEGAAPYYHMSHSELLTLLLQREAELERQGSEFERQGALLEKREAELRKMKAQTRDLEDYIDRLLVQIMEQKPNLLQVRNKLK